VILLPLAIAAAFAFDFTALKPQGYVSDFAGVIDARSRMALERYAAALEHSTGAQVAVVTLPSLEGEPVEDVANALYRKWGIGQKGSNEGALLLLSIRDRRSRLEVGYGLEPILPDAAAGDVLRAMRPDLRAGRYGPALIEAMREIGGRIAAAKGVAVSAPAPARPRRRTAERGLPAGLVFAGFILFAVLSGMIGGSGGRRRNSGGFGGLLPALILGNMMGRTFDHRHGGGGFGGFDSGGGFGGFGGGDSGGGGASSSW
jgi:uncharacterized protein